MNGYQTPSIAIRVTSLAASVVVTVLIVGSQLGLVDGRAQQADAMVAAKNAKQQTAQHTAASRQPRS